MQAATESGKVLTLSEVKNIMKETAIHDSWVTDGANASHFGNGKIDALAGIQYILENYHDIHMGDVNHDGWVNIEDITKLISRVLNPEAQLCPICADLSGDGQLTIEDVTRLILKVLSGDTTSPNL